MKECAVIRAHYFLASNAGQHKTARIECADHTTGIDYAVDPLRSANSTRVSVFAGEKAAVGFVIAKKVIDILIGKGVRDTIAIKEKIMRGLWIKSPGSIQPRIAICSGKESGDGPVKPRYAYR